MIENKKEEDKIMTNEEMIEKVENATEDEIVELLKEFAGAAENTEEELNEKERYFIKLYQADTFGYNSTVGNK